MRKPSQIALVAIAISFAGYANAQATSNNWKSASGEVWKSASGECWRDANWTPATADPACDGALIAKTVASTAVAPAPIPAAPVAAPNNVQAPPASPVVAAPAAKVKMTAEALFDFDKAVIKPEGKQHLDALVAQIHSIHVEVLIAVGYTDAVGTVAYNKRLSIRRAEAVKGYLVSKGLDRSRIYTEGRGKTQPVASNANAKGRALNRRVEIEVVGTALAR
jgi:OOP family OmpA-OmpF porin